MGAGGRGDVDDGAGAACLHRRYRAPRTIEVAVDIALEGLPPGGGVQAFDRAGGAGGAGVVDQHVEAPAEAGERSLEQAVHRACVADVDDLGLDPWVGGGHVTGGVGIAITGVYGGTGFQEGLDDSAADAGSAAGNDDVLVAHGGPPRRWRWVYDPMVLQTGFECNLIVGGT